jgi:glycosyltransferase involved in cell wall biosynthesis
MNKPFFTVFTPVYNSKSKIHRVWESLNSQTLKDFEWIVVDDGSTDDVVDLILDYKSKADFEVIIERQTNKGKHVAWNKALELANGFMFVPADADDRFIPTTLKFLHDKWFEIKSERQNSFSGINVLCKDNVKNEIVGEEYPNDGMESNLLELTHKLRVKGEKWGCIRIDLLKKFKFPEIYGRGCYILSYAWYGLSKSFKIKCYNTPLRIYYIDAPSITKPKNFLNKRYKEAETWLHYLNWHFANNSRYIFKYDKLHFFKSVFAYMNFWFYCKNRKFYKFTDVKPIFIRVLMYFFWLPAFFYNKLERLTK